MPTEEQHIIKEVARRLKHGDYTYQVKSYLKTKNLSPEEIEKYMTFGRDLYIQKKLKSIPLRNKIIFGTFLTLLFTVIVYFTIIYPNEGSKSYDLLCLTGTLLFFTFALCTILFFNSWKRDLIRKRIATNEIPNVGTAFFIGIIPAILFYFISDVQFKKGVENLFNKHKVFTIGYVVDGYTNQDPLNFWTMNEYPYSELSIAFTSNTGRKITITKEVTKAVYDKLWEDEEVQLVYSALDPLQYELLLGQKAILKHTGINNRTLYPIDLIALFNTPLGEMKNHLNNISYEWEQYSKNKNTWNNLNRSEELTVENRIITYSTADPISRSYKNPLKELGFEKIKTNRNGFMEEEVYATHKYEIALKFDLLTLNTYQFVATIKKL